MKTRLLALFVVLAFGAIIAPVMANNFPGQGSTCTTNPDDGSKLPECGSKHDNECNPGGVLYREENQDGCPTEWYWKAGWYLSRFNDGAITRENFPKEFESVLPPLEKIVASAGCTLDLTGISHGIVTVPSAVLARDASSLFPNIFSDGTNTWMWHNGSSFDDLGIRNLGDIHVYNIGSGWNYPTAGNCAVNLP